MLVTIKHFYEDNHEDTLNYQNLWSENEDRMIHLPIHMNETQQALHISRTLISNPNPKKDILAIKMPPFIERNSIFRQIQNGVGFSYNGDKKWYPTEVWILYVLT